MAPRYSIIPGRFVEDARPDVNHFRVLTKIGTHTDEEGWCKLKQITIANAIDCTRETVNRKLKDLVEWGYVEKDDTDGTGRAIKYRVLIDAPVSRGSQVEPTCEEQITPGVRAEDHSRCDASESHITITSTSLLNDSPLPPKGEGEGGGDFNQGWAKGWTPAARAAAHDARQSVIRARPITVFLDAVRGTLNPPRDADPAAYVRQLVSKLGEFDEAALLAAADVMLATRERDLPSALAVEREARSQTAKRQGVVDATRAIGTRSIAEGSPEWAAYMAHIGPEKAAAYVGSKRLGVAAALLAEIMRPATEADHV